MSDKPESAADDTAAATSPGELGVWLREAREARKQSVAGVAQALRLDPGIIEALEGEAFDGLGALVFVRGHLRALANHLKLDPAEAVARFHAASAIPENAEPALIVSHSRPQRQRSLRGLAVLLALVAVVALVATAAWWLWPDADDLSDVQPTDARQVTTTLPAANSQPPQPASTQDRDGRAQEALSAALAANTASVDSDVREVVQEPATRAATATDAGVRLIFSDACWFEVRDANDRRLAFGTATAGTDRTITGERPLRVTLGVANAVQVIVDGEPYTIAPDERRGRAARLTID